MQGTSLAHLSCCLAPRNVSNSAVSDQVARLALEQQLSGDVDVVAGPEPDRDIKMPRHAALVDQAAKHEQQSRSGQGQVNLCYP